MSKDEGGREGEPAVATAVVGKGGAMARAPTQGKDKGLGKGKRAGPDRSFQGNFPSQEFQITNMQLNLCSHYIHELENSIWP